MKDPRPPRLRPTAGTFRHQHDVPGASSTSPLTQAGGPPSMPRSPERGDSVPHQGRGKGRQLRLRVDAHCISPPASGRPRRGTPPPPSGTGARKVVLPCALRFLMRLIILGACPERRNSRRLTTFTLRRSAGGVPIFHDAHPRLAAEDAP